MGFFDFLTRLPKYAENPRATSRMNHRHAFLVEQFAADIAGARVLDLASHDGRWSYALAGAGAASVVGIEGRAELVAMFDDYPDAALRDRVSLRVGDIFDQLERAIAAGETFDVVAVFGIYYHIMDHMRLLKLIRAVKPKLVIIDSEFADRPNAVINLIREKTDNVLNAIPEFPGQKVAVKGIPSFKAMEFMADAAEFDLTWSDWDSLAQDDRVGVFDYFRPKSRKLRRATCALRPRA